MRDRTLQNLSDCTSSRRNPITVVLFGLALSIIRSKPPVPSTYDLDHKLEPMRAIVPAVISMRENDHLNSEIVLMLSRNCTGEKLSRGKTLFYVSEDRTIVTQNGSVPFPTQSYAKSKSNHAPSRCRNHSKNPNQRMVCACSKHEQQS